MLPSSAIVLPWEEGIIKLIVACAGEPGKQTPGSIWPGQAIVLPRRWLKSFHTVDGFPEETWLGYSRRCDAGPERTSDMRQSGILLHLTSLPSPEGLGTLGAEARHFADFLKKAGMRVWQVLPISPTGYAESPYQCFSTYAGNPLLIDLRTLKRQGILKTAEPLELPGDPERADYAPVIAHNNRMLSQAFEQSYERLKDKVQQFREENAGWIEDFALFMAIKRSFGGISWQDWPDESIRMRGAAAMHRYKKELKRETDEQVFIQYLFFQQWFSLKRYVNERGISLFGDMPIYVAEDSSDAWANPKVFQLDSTRRPTRVAGVPPDYFSADGQRWGNPLYNWPYLKRTGYDWWIKRLRAMGRFFDITRVDHFIGFANYYSVPADEDTARNGVWMPGPSRHFFEAVKRELPDMRIVPRTWARSAQGPPPDEVRRYPDEGATFASGDPTTNICPNAT